MFDKMIFKAKIDTADIDTIVLKNYLEQCTEGDEIYYKSTAYANFDGCFIEIRGDTLKCKCSIHKLYSRGKSGKLDNSRPMTFSHAGRTINELLLRLCAKIENVIVTYYEIGVTMKMSMPADAYIRQVEEAAGRVLWNDANYPEFRQKTTEKSKYYRKVLKIYDKSFEAGEKGRNVGANILRIETVYKHQSIPLAGLLDNASLNKIGRIFYKDWSEMQFVRELQPVKGVKLSQLDKAREIQRIGVTRYKERYKALFQAGKLTKKQWETIRVFANNWHNEKDKYIEEIGPLEAEFKEKLLAGFQSGSIAPIKKRR